MKCLPFLAFFTAAICLCSVVANGQLQNIMAENFDEEQARADFERLAAELPFLSLSAILYDRPGDRRFQRVIPVKAEKYSQVMGEVTDGTYASKMLLSLLRHDDAKVRTLAAVALFDREDPSVLPSLVELADDESVIFDGFARFHSLPIGHDPVEPVKEQQTVGQVARRMVSFYMKPAGFGYGIAHETKPGFSEYWNARKNRSHCASWFAVQLARASQEISPTRNDRIDRIGQMRKRIDKLPADERTWTLLFLNRETGSDALVTEQELIEACSSMGADKLVLMLQKKIPSDDPDLQPRSTNNGRYKRMQLFVLRRANQLLRSSDSEALLACDSWERDYQKHGFSDPLITSWWAVAAARLQPDKAPHIIDAAIKRLKNEGESDGQAALYVALWQLCGKPKMEVVLDWLFEPVLERDSVPNAPSQFIKSMGVDPNGRAIVVQIIRDKRLDKLDWRSLKELINVVNSWTTEPVVTERELQKAWHPLGIGNYQFEQNKDQARKDYPAETKELEEHFSLWRERLRLSLTELL